MLVTRLHLHQPSRWLVALYCSPRPREPYCLHFPSELMAEEWADNVSSAVWQLQHATVQAALTTHSDDTSLVSRSSGSPMTLGSEAVAITSNDSRLTPSSGSLGEIISTSIPPVRDEVKLDWANRHKGDPKHRQTPYTIWATTQDNAVYFHDSAVPPTKVLST